MIILETDRCRITSWCVIRHHLPPWRRKGWLRRRPPPVFYASGSSLASGCRSCGHDVVSMTFGHDALSMTYGPSTGTTSPHRLRTASQQCQSLAGWPWTETWSRVRWSV